MMASRERLVRAGSVAVLVCSLVAVAATAAGIRAVSLAGPGPLDTGLGVGTSLAVPAAFTSDAGRPTLLVFLQSSCTASQMVVDRMPAVRTRMAAAGVRVVAVVSASGEARETAVAAAAGFDSAETWSTPFEGLPLRAVPAFVFVDAAGQVLRQRAGVIDAPRDDPFFDGVLTMRN